MHILFALIFVMFPYGVYAQGVPVRIGAFEKLAQCKEQGRNLVTAMDGQELRSAYFFCVPVNQ